MKDMPDRYNITVTITLEADETKKNAIRDWLDKKLQEYRNDGTIKSATITINRVTVPERITLSEL